jgi:hypothetical protein
MHTNIHALSGLQTYDHNVQAGEDCATTVISSKFHTNMKFRIEL